MRLAVGVFGPILCQATLVVVAGCAATQPSQFVQEIRPQSQKPIKQAGRVLVTGQITVEHSGTGSPTLYLVRYLDSTNAQRQTLTSGSGERFQWLLSPGSYLLEAKFPPLTQSSKTIYLAGFSFDVSKEHAMVYIGDLHLRIGPGKDLLEATVTDNRIAIEEILKTNKPDLSEPIHPQLMQRLDSFPSYNVVYAGRRSKIPGGAMLILCVAGTLLAGAGGYGAWVC